MADLGGRTIKGYELRECIGTGGFGAVYRAHQHVVNRDVAVKVILPERANHPDFIRRFDLEAQVVARLEHPHIVPLYDYWREPGGAYLVMRWLPGNLQQALQAGPWALDAVGRLLTQIAGALHVAHRHGVVHRDIKPANILLDEDRNAYLADFGIAKILNLSTGVTSPGSVIGSPDYLTPEQIRSEPLTPLTDLYSLGLVLYELLVGERPFCDSTPSELIYKHLNEPLPSVKQRRPELPLALDAVVQTATAKEPTQRYPDALRLAAAFNALVEAPRRVPAQPLVEPLTARELEILGMLDGDLTNAQIAERLVLTPGTVKWYLQQIFGKLDVHSRAQAARHAHELGLIPPDAATHSIRAVEPAPAAVLRMEVRSFLDLPTIAPENPYKGLRAFQEADALDFFGREALTRQLLERLAEDHPLKRFLAIVGPSGSGKSSLVKAGLVPMLRRGAISDSDRWFVAEMLPGAHPLEELEIALTRLAAKALPNMMEQLQRDPRGLLRVARIILPETESQLLLIVDQFEEVFTQVENAVEVSHFLKSLYAAVVEPRSPVRVIITLRADFYDRPLVYPDFSHLVGQRTHVVVPMTAAELERVIVAPSEWVGVSIETGLVAAIVGEVSEQPGVLPMLQYALTELFDQRSDHTLTLESYHGMGGVLGVLAHQADAVYQELSPDQQLAARQIFLRLVTLGEGTEDMRRRVRHSELASVIPEPELLQGVLDSCVQSRLLTLDRDLATHEPTVDVAHEAIIREWPRLREWLDESRSDIRQQRLLATATAEWLRAGRDTGYLLSGSRLAQFETWEAATSLRLSLEERDYLDCSILDHQERQAAERERQRRELELAKQAVEAATRAERSQRRAANFLRYLVAAMVVFLVVAVALALFAFGQRNLAQRSANESLSLALASDARQAWLVENDPDLALSLAVHAGTIPQAVPQVRDTLSSIALAPGVRRVFAGHTSPVMAVAISPDGRYLLTGSGRIRTFMPDQADNTIRLWDLETGVVIRRLEGHTDAVWHLAFSPDGQAAFSASSDGKIFHWDLVSGLILRRYAETDGYPSPIFSMALSPDGQFLLSGDMYGRLRLFDTNTGKELRSFQGVSEIYDLAFSLDGRTIYTSGILSMGSSRLTGAAAAWDVETGDQLRRFDVTDTVALREGPTDCNAAFSPGGRTVLGVRGDYLVLYDTSSGDEIRRFEKVHTGWITALAISPDGHLALTASEDATIILWNLDTGTLIRQYRGHQGSVMSVAFSPDGLNAVSGSVDGTARLWDLDSGNEIRVLRAEGFQQMEGLAIAQDGQTALTSAGDSSSGGNALVVWDLDSGQVLRTLPDQPDIAHSVAIAPDGRLALSVASDGKLRVWDVASGTQLHEYALSSPYPSSVAFSPDGSKAAVATQAVIYVLELDTGREINTYLVGQPANDVTFAPDGRAVLYGASDATVGLIDVVSDTLKQAFVGHPSAVQAVAISPNGRYVLSGGADPFLILWDASTGTEIRRLALPTSGTVNSLAFAPDGSVAVSGLADGVVVLWDIATGDVLASFVGHSGPVHCVRFRIDGRTVLSVGADGTLREWTLPPSSMIDWMAWTLGNRHVRDLTADEQAYYGLPVESAVGRLRETPGAPAASAQLSRVSDSLPTTAPTPVAALSISHRAEARLGDNRGMLSADSGHIWSFVGNAGEMVIVQAIAERPATGVYDPIEQVAQGLLDTTLVMRGPDGTRLAENDDAAGVRNTDARVDVLLPESGTYEIEVASYQALTGGSYSLRLTPVQVIRERSRVEYDDGDGIWAVAISPNGQRALSSRGPGGVWVINATESVDISFTEWDVSQTPIRELRHFNQSGEAHAQSVTGLTYCNEGRTMLSSSWDGSMALWDVDTGGLLSRMVGHLFIPYPVCAPDGRTAVSTSYDGTLRVWDLTTGQELRRLNVGGVSQPFALTPDGRTALFGADGIPGLAEWDVVQGGAWRVFAEQASGTTVVAVSPDARWVAAGDFNADIILLDRTTGQAVRRLEGHSASLSTNLMFTPDSRRLLSGSYDGTMRLWDVETGEEVARFLGHESGMWSFGLSADGRTLVSGSYDGTLRVWDVPAPDEPS